MKMQRTLGLVFSLCILSMMILACSSGKKPEKVGDGAKQDQNSQDEKKTETKIFNIGEKIQLGDNVVVINAIEEYTSNNEFIKPEQGKKFVVIDVTVENAGKEPIDYNTYDYKLQDSKDYSYDTAMATKEPNFNSGSLQPGQKTRGWVPYQVPVDEKKFKVIFTPSWLSSDQVIVNAELK